MSNTHTKSRGVAILQRLPSKLESRWRQFAKAHQPRCGLTQVVHRRALAARSPYASAGWLK